MLIQFQALRLVCLSAVVALCSASALAHVIVKQSVPADGAVLEVAPNEVVITFNEKVEAMFSTATLGNAAGATVGSAKAKVNPANPTELRLRVPALQSGKYVVQWTAVGSDGHRRTGDIGFTVK